MYLCLRNLANLREPWGIDLKFLCSTVPPKEVSAGCEEQNKYTTWSNSP